MRYYYQQKVNKINYIFSLKDCEDDVDKDFYTDNYALIDYNPKNTYNAVN